MNRTTTGFGRSNGFNNSIDLNNSSTIFIQSKDKRNQMHAPDVKQFILDENLRKNMSSAHGISKGGVTSVDFGDMATYT